MTEAELETEVDALLAPMPADGKLEGEELKRFNSLNARIGLLQARDVGDERMAGQFERMLDGLC